MSRTDSAQTVTLVGEPRDVLVARAFVRRALAEQSNHAATDDAIAVTSELVTNSVMHGRGPIKVTISVDEGVVEIAVADTAPAVPAQRDPDLDDEGGRGLQIVTRLSDAWWSEVTPEGKTTVARIALVRR